MNNDIEIIYACFLRNGDRYEVVGFTRTAKKASEWAQIMLDGKMDIQVKTISSLEE